MKTASCLALASLAVLAGCADVPFEPSHNRGYPSAPRAWGYERGQQAPSIISEAEASSLNDEVVSLKGQRSTLVNNLPRVSDPATRSQHLRSIDEINSRLQMLEYRLRAAGRPVPR